MPVAKVNGVQLHYEEHGSGFPLVLSHGGYSDLTRWEESLPTLSQHYRVIVYDRRNCGQSTKAPDADTYDLWVEDLYQLLRHLGINRAYVGGSSLGALLTLEFTLAHPNVVEAALLFSGSTAGYEPNERFRVTFPNRQGRVGHLTLPILLINGAQDTSPSFVPANAQQTAKDLPNSELAILYGVGHGVNQEAPGIFTSLVLGFLAKQDTRRDAKRTVAR
ncbi:MAG: alpha/beta hydrolase [Dehalococcoidia bacterium]|nr:alpha/beta hydrolase [Dehalococcoidia bacterium]